MTCEPHKELSLEDSRLPEGRWGMSPLRPVVGADQTHSSTFSGRNTEPDMHELGHCICPYVTGVPVSIKDALSKE